MHTEHNYTNNEMMKIISSSRMYKIICYNATIYYFLQRDNNKVLKFLMNKFSYFEISASLF